MSRESMNSRRKKWTSRLTLWLHERPPTVLGLSLLLIAMVWGFIELTDEVLEGETRAFDKYVVKSFRHSDDPSVPIGPPWLREGIRDITAFGSIGVISFFVLATAGYLWIDKRYRTLVYLLIVTLSGMAWTFGLKHWLARPRPEVVPHLSEVFTSSFPSGHSMLSAVVYLTLGAVLSAAIQPKRLKVYVLFIAIVLSVLVGLSRVYLGVHYPTDVLAGWMAGLIWAILCWCIARWLQHHRQVESP